MSLLSEAKPFTDQQLGALEDSIDSTVLTWAIDNPAIRPPGQGHQLIRDIATLQAISRATLAEGRLADYKFSTVIAEDQGMMTETLGMYSPKEKAGTAVGQLAITKLITKWYGLNSADFSRHSMPKGVMEYMRLVIPEVEQTVCLNPQTLGFVDFDYRDVYFEEQNKAVAAIEEKGPSAIAPYIEFPEFPIS